MVPVPVGLLLLAGSGPALGLGDSVTARCSNDPAVPKGTGLLVASSETVMPPGVWRWIFRLWWGLLLAWAHG